MGWSGLRKKDTLPENSIRIEPSSKLEYYTAMIKKQQTRQDDRWSSQKARVLRDTEEQQKRVDKQAKTVAQAALRRARAILQAA